MKTIKQFFTLAVLVLFVSTSVSVYSQLAESDPNESLTNNVFATVLYKADHSSSNYIIETHYFEKIDATITFTLEEDRKKLISIEDPSNNFSEDFLMDVLISSNNKANYSNENMAGSFVATSSVVGCAWWDVMCHAIEAMCKALGCDE